MRVSEEHRHAARPSVEVGPERAIGEGGLPVRALLARRPNPVAAVLVPDGIPADLVRHLRPGGEKPIRAASPRAHPRPPGKAYSASDPALRYGFPRLLPTSSNRS